MQSIIPNKANIWFMRNSPWGIEKDVFDRVIRTQKLICPKGHSKKDYHLFLNNQFAELFVVSKRRKFIESLKINDIIILFHKKEDHYLVLKIASDASAEILEDTCLILDKDYESTGNYKPYFIGSREKAELRMNILDPSREYVIDTMHSIVRDVEIVGRVHKKNSRIFRENATCQQTIWKSNKMSAAELRELLISELL
jgi:hypothetical protein